MLCRSKKDDFYVVFNLWGVDALRISVRKRFVNRNFPVKRHEPQKMFSVKKFHALLIVAVKEVSQFNNTSQLTLNILCARRASWVLGRKVCYVKKGIRGNHATRVQTWAI